MTFCVALAGSALAQPTPVSPTPASTVVPSLPKTKAYLSLQGIEGESQDSQHKDWIEILSFQAPRDLAAAITSPRDPQTGAMRAMLTTLVFTKRVDRASPRLRTALAQGAHFATVVLDVVSPANGEYYEMTMRNAAIVRLVSGGGDLPSESVTMVANQIEMKYAKLDAQGGHGPLRPVVVAPFVVRALTPPRSSHGAIRRAPGSRRSR